MKGSEPYIIKGIEEVYDGSNNLMCKKPIVAVRVMLSSFEDVLESGRRVLQSKVDEYRAKKEMNDGTFIACVTNVRDLEGKVLYNYSGGKKWN